VLYGGMHWEDTDLDISDELEQEKEIYLENAHLYTKECGDLFQNNGLSDISEIGSFEQKEAFRLANIENCYSDDLTMETVIRRPYYSTSKIFLIIIPHIIYFRCVDILHSELCRRLQFKRRMQFWKMHVFEGILWDSVRIGNMSEQSLLL